MRCRHGNVGKCSLCNAEQVRGVLLVEVARLVFLLGDSAGLDVSKLESLLKEM